MRIESGKRSFDFTLPGGRTVHLIRLYLQLTYLGQLEGDETTGSPIILDRSADSVRHWLPPGEPLLVIAPKSMPLPRFQVAVELDSSAGVRTNRPDYASRLFVTWFIDDLVPDITAWIQAVLPEIDWDWHAADYDLTFI